MGQCMERENLPLSEFERAILRPMEEGPVLLDQLHDEDGAIEGCYRTRSAPTE